MSKKIFVDTSAFLALTNRSDQYHTKAVQCLESLHTQRASFVTTNFVLDEAYTRLRKKAGVGVAIAFGEKVRSDRSLKIVTVEGGLEKEAWEIFGNRWCSIW